MQNKLALLVLCCALTACGRPDPSAETAPFWTCDGLEFAAQPRDGGVEIALPGYTETLPPVEGEARSFRRAGVRLRFVDDGAVLDLDAARYACEPKRWTGPWAQARERGAEFRAIGQEPGWHVEVVPGGELTLVLDYGERTLTLPAPDVAALDRGARGYQGEDRNGRLVLVVIEPLVCFDIMSGEVFPDTVTVAVDDERYRGCGTAL